MPRGWLATLEGIDGSGKSSLAGALHAALRQRGLDAELAREPTDSELGQAVKRSLRSEADPFAEAFLFLADHAAESARVRGLVQRGKVVVSDRWGESCLAYQGAALEPLLAPRGIRALDWLAAAQAPVHLAPDCCILLDLPPEEALRRIAGRDELVKYERLAVLEQVRRNYLALAERHKYIEVLDARQAPDALLREALARLRARGLLA